MRLRSAAIIGMMLSLGLILGSCGEDRTAADPPGTVRTAPAQPQPAKQQHSPAGSCRGQLGEFLSSMAGLRQALARGLSYDEYLPRVRGVRTVYNRIPTARLNAACLLLVAGPAERAFNLYIDAANTWGDCLAIVACGTTSVEPKLQRMWASASNRFSLAQKNFRSVRG
ncbi:MAG: hypothetical protein ACRDLL_11820 [Solirubrobacterales bacterium]